ncbi:MAG: type II toxin-antitoxin system RelE/ParE family toxin [Treponema sp.]|nr:type II toxin-antitoxin system RelE/ParE family toxin [Treponema sp.]
MWEVEYTDEFGAWWETLNADEQDAVTFSVRLLRVDGPQLKFPHSTGVKGSRHGAMRELRSQCKGKPLRTFYAFDPRRAAILLIGGNKTGDGRFYGEMIPKADKIYDEYLAEIQEEGNG